MVKHWTRR
ncbi:hypothetical protein ACHAWF_001644 [Thalassiosira exigua]